MHSLGAAGTTAYLASPQAGLLSSDDGGRSWQSRNIEVGRSFMGTILVDPANPQRLVALDIQNGLVTSSDGGSTWTDLTLPTGTSAATFSADGATLYAAALDGDTARTFASTDAGTTWIAR